MNLFITGAGGQVGREMVREGKRRGVRLLGLPRSELDITEPERVREFLRNGRRPPSVVVNLAAFTDVDGAEADPREAFRVNGEAVKTLARECADSGIPLIHISTDYVFGGEFGGKFRETDPTHPVNAYGESKVSGEEALRRTLPEHLIVRTSWLFSPWGRNFVRTMLKLAGKGREVRVVGDEEGCPTAALHLAQTLLAIAERISLPQFSAWGTYHFCGRPSVSRADFARAVFQGATESCGVPLAKVREISTKDYPAPATRPRKVVLECRKIQDVFQIQQPEWRPYLFEILGALAAGEAEESAP